MEEDTQ